jgi:hypothetical protein
MVEAWLVTCGCACCPAARGAQATCHAGAAASASQADDSLTVRRQRLLLLEARIADLSCLSVCGRMAQLLQGQFTLRTAGLAICSASGAAAVFLAT